MIQSFERDATPNEVSEILLRDGVVTVRERVPEEMIQQLERDCQPSLETTELGAGGAYFGNGSSKTISGMFNESFVLGEMMCDSLLTGVADIVIGPNCDRYQIGQGILLQVWKWEGAATQGMHRDSMSYSPYGYVQFVDSRPVQVQFMFAVSDFTANNGATRFVVGSHRWPDDRAWHESEVDVAVMPRGSVTMWLGGTLHGFGINTTDKPRTGVTAGFTVGWLRQEENQYLAISPERAAQFPKKVRDLLGWAPHGAFLGYYRPPSSTEAVIDPGQAAIMGLPKTTAAEK